MTFKHAFLTSKGITLVELLVTISISVFIFGAIFSLFREGLISYDRTVSEADQQLELRHIQDVMKRDIVNSVIGTKNGKTYPYREDSKLYLLTNSDGAPQIVIYSFEDQSLYRIEEIYRVEDGGTDILQKDCIAKDISFHVEIDETINLVNVTVAKSTMTNYSKQPVDKKIIVQAKPRGKLKDMD